MSYYLFIIDALAVLGMPRLDMITEAARASLLERVTEIVLLLTSIHRMRNAYRHYIP